MTVCEFDALLPSVEKPSRYIGAEVNTARRGKSEVTFLLSFPDTYEVGMSHLGLQILYSILNNISFVSAERCFAPWPDREQQLRRQKIPLTSLETQTPIGDFDLIGFSLQYELSYTNVLNMLDLGKIPIRRQYRKDEHPLIIAGGPCCFNPSPLADFFDAFVIGEGEEVVSDIVSAIRESKKQRSSRANCLELIAQISGVYVPALHDKKKIITKRIVSDLNLWQHPEKPLVPVMQTIHDRIVLEIARGCTRGCRFCQAGMIWRPYRERNTSLLMEMAEKYLNATGHDEISLLSLSSGDYTCIEALIKNLMDRYFARRVALALPSLRVESLTSTLIDEIKRIRKTSFTLAPEAGTEKMRQIINKGNTSQELIATVDRVFSAGWKSIKLYYMLGLPHEQQEDIEGIVALSHEAMRAAGKRGQITISLSTFVPKPHTPFQWEEQISLEETYNRQNYIRKQIKNRRLSLKWHDARMSFLEGIFSRGDESLGKLLEAAFHKGCRFDGWSDKLRFDLWQEAIEGTSINPRDYLGARNREEALPWDNIDCHLSREFLWEEKQKAQEALPTPDCRFSSCQLCGVCDFSAVKNIFAQPPENKVGASSGQIPAAQDASQKIYRFEFSKLANARFFSHLEISSALTRALRRSNLSIIYSSGYHPHPKISFAGATAVGMESHKEFMDVKAQQYGNDLTALQKEINGALPQGLQINGIRMLSFAEKTLSQALYGFNYMIMLPPDIDVDKLRIIENNINNFMALASFNISRTSKGKTVIKDIRPSVESLKLDTAGKSIECTVRHSQTGSARPLDIIVHVAGFGEDEARQMQIIKAGTILV